MRGIAWFRSLSGTTVEILHILVGLAAAVGITWAAAWSYPLGHEVIWWCGAAAMVATVVMGIGPLRRARRLDRRAAGDGDGRTRGAGEVEA
jgi:hypothetical protein